MNELLGYIAGTFPDFYDVIVAPIVYNWNSITFCIILFAVIALPIMAAVCISARAIVRAINKKGATQHATPIV